ncbi:MAG: short-chain fatty acid transporter [Dehalococcoidales bacterium]|nr:short-chain fatty acid transporter [Dehalococcoidales bacterium]
MKARPEYSGRMIAPIEKMGYVVSRNVEKWFPDPFIFAIILLVLVFIVAGVVEQRNPYLLMQDMYQGFWSFLSFAMQMCIILVTGYALAFHPRVRRGIAWLCTLPRNGKQAAALVALGSCVFSWVNWGLGLIVGASLAREMGRQSYVRRLTVHYPVLCAAGYTGLGTIWHWGLSGSAPLLVTAEGNFLEKTIGIVPVSQTIFSQYSLYNSLIMLVFAVLVCYLLHPSASGCRGIEYYAPALIEKEEDTRNNGEKRFLADRLENSPWLALVVVVLMAGSMVYWFSTKGFMRGLDINAVNFCFILAGFIVYLNPVRYMRAVYQAAGEVGGIILQFPFYAGIQGVMMYSGLGATIAAGLVKVASPLIYPVIALLVAAISNIFIPSGGGEFLAVGESISRAGVALGVPAGKFITAYAAGDAWTNLFNPFWAIPLLAITRIKAREMFGSCIVIMILAVIPLALGLTFVPY